MTRPLRPLLADGIYHLTDRGNRGQTVFRDDLDRQAFLALFRRVIRELSWHPLAWCTLGNHYHLLVQTPSADLHTGMRRLNGTYAMRFNHRHGTRGHLWQGRYHSVLVRREAHLLDCFRYIAANPVKAGLCAGAADFAWSSHRQMLGHAGPGPVDRERVLGIFGAWGGDGIDRYVDYTTPEDELRPRVVPDPQPDPVAPAIGELIRRHGEATGTAIALDVHGFTMSEIAAELGCHVSTVSRRLAHRR